MREICTSSLGGGRRSALQGAPPPTRQQRSRRTNRKPQRLIFGVAGRSRWRRKKERFTALLHHVMIDLLKHAYSWLKREAAPGVDGQTWQSYKQNLEVNLAELHSRIHRGTYRALPSRRRYIPKPDGRQRPLGIAACRGCAAHRARRGV